MDHSTKTSGPEIDGQPSIISFFAPGQLKTYPYIKQLRLLINAAFVSNHCGPASDYVFPPDLRRLDSDEQLLVEFGSDTFTYIVSSPIQRSGAPPRLYATGSGSPFRPKTSKEGVPDHVTQVMQRTKPLDLEGKEYWEMRTLVVDPTLQNQGMGSLLMTLMEGEITRRSTEARLQRSKVESSTPMKGGQVPKMNEAVAAKKLVLTLNTCKEVDEAYYLRRGWVTTEVNPVGRAFNASRDWHICWMERDVSIPSAKM